MGLYLAEIVRATNRKGTAVKNRITRRRFLEQAARAAGGAALGSLPII
ncbi:MAG: twin-arginine translocation signal domain-containing protein, partial [Candidatus Aminicenantes bacterium]|nr:twin-arginine translocation signal domain-containing protein [Candidatus Aminicenantes bacterium]